MDGLIETRVSVLVTNLGQSPGPAAQPVEAEVDGFDAEVVHLVTPLPGGENVSFNFTRRLSPGDHTLSLTLGDAADTTKITARAVDLSLIALGSRVTGNGFIAIDATVTNHGNLAAESVAISAEWSPDAESGPGSYGRLERAASIPRLDPGENVEISVPIQAPAGSYKFTLTAHTDTTPAFKTRNADETSVQMDYVDLEVAVGKVRRLGYRADGSRLLEIPFTVTNRGVAPSGPINAGVLCLAEPPNYCSIIQTLDPIQPGAAANLLLSLALPQGESTLRIFAGGPEDRFQSDDKNVREINVQVAERSPPQLSIEVDTEVTGYWSDGMAGVEVTAFLSNDGRRPFEDPVQVNVTCLRDDLPIDNCGHSFTASMDDGFEADAQTFDLRLPMGRVSLRFDLYTDSAATHPPGQRPGTHPGRHKGGVGLLQRQTRLPGDAIPRRLLRRMRLLGIGDHSQVAP